MTVTVDLSAGPKLAPKTDVSVHIIKLPAKAALADSLARRLGRNPSEAELLADAAKHVPQAKNTDIVVFDHRPWHVVNNALHAHPQVHVTYPETILKISFGAAERAVWWSEQPFKITSVRPHPPHVHNSPGEPFDGAWSPFEAVPEPDVTGHVTVYAVRTDKIVHEAIGQRYKITFDIGEPIDPDMEGAP